MYVIEVKVRRIVWQTDLLRQCINSNILIERNNELIKGDVIYDNSYTRGGY